MTNLKKFFKDESGATAIEYGLLAALISIVAVGAFTTAGSNLNVVFEEITGALAITEAPAE